MYQFFRSVVYDPIKARIVYDSVSALVCAVGIWVLLRLFDADIPNPLFFLVIPFLFVNFCAAFGLYGRYRLVSVLVKATALLCAGVLTVLTLLVLNVPLFYALLTVLIALIVTTLPRISLAFSFNTKGQLYTSTLKQDHLPVLVVGGGGYIGSHVVEQLLNEGFLVRVFDTFQYGKEVLSDLQSNPHLELIEGDISDIYKLTLAMQGVGSVVHLAGIVGDPACAVDPELTRHVNIVSTRILKESVKAFGIRRFIFSSSCSVYGFSKKQVSEKDKLNPVSLYAQTKIDSENELLKDTYDAFHPTILRFATVFGHSRKPRFDLVANLFLAQAYHTGIITLTGKDQWRPFIHVKDVARAVVMVLKAPEEVVSRQIFNVGDESMNMKIGTLAALAATTVKKSKKKVAVHIEEKQDMGDKRNYHVSFERIRSTFLFHASVTMEEGMKEMYDNWKEGVYRRDFTDSYYSNLENAKELKQAFHSSEYQTTHISVLSEAKKVDRVRKSYGKK